MRISWVHGSLISCMRSILKDFRVQFNFFLTFSLCDCLESFHPCALLISCTISTNNSMPVLKHARKCNSEAYMTLFRLISTILLSMWFISKSLIYVQMEVVILHLREGESFYLYRQFPFCLLRMHCLKRKWMWHTFQSPYNLKKKKNFEVWFQKLRTESFLDLELILNFLFNVSASFYVLVWNFPKLFRNIIDSSSICNQQYIALVFSSALIQMTSILRKALVI